MASPCGTAGLETAWPVVERSIEKKKTLDPELEGETDKFVMDDPEIDSIESMLLRGPTYDVTSIPPEMTEEELRYICRLYKIPESAGACLIALGEDPARPPNGTVVVAERFFECGLAIPFPPFFQEIIFEIVLAPTQLNPMYGLLFVGTLHYGVRGGTLPPHLLSWPRIIASRSILYVIKRT